MREQVSCYVRCHPPVCGWLHSNAPAGNGIDVGVTQNCAIRYELLTEIGVRLPRRTLDTMLMRSDLAIHHPRRSAVNKTDLLFRHLRVVKNEGAPRHAPRIEP